ncbi:MAG: hypothetical protein RMJ15_05850 [Nitrososphaerota archaeon]|nr:hypothetical protein [Nitrososphaerota archaeon]
MGKIAWGTPLYISVAWILMVSYQMFTHVAVTTLVSYINMFWPFLGTWLTSRVDMINFVFAFAWVFVLSSVIPSIMLGKERSVLIQFLVCLTLTFLAFIAYDVLKAYGGVPVERFLSLAVFLKNPFIAIVYLLIPYVLMFAVDAHARRKRKKERELLEMVTNAYLQNAVTAEQKAKK